MKSNCCKCKKQIKGDKWKIRENEVVCLECYRDWLIDRQPFMAEYRDTIT